MIFVKIIIMDHNCLVFLNHMKKEYSHKLTQVFNCCLLFGLFYFTLSMDLYSLQILYKFNCFCGFE